MSTSAESKTYDLLSLSSSGNELQLRLAGRLDSTNATQVEDALIASGALQAQAGLTLDIGQLEYLSSAGMRVLLRIQKALPKKMMLVNAQPNVFEVLTISGLSELMHVVRQPREVSLEGCEIVGRGAYGVVYQLDEDTIVKLYPANYPLAELVRERELSRYAFVQGIPTAIPLDIVRAGDALGLSYEMVRSQSMQNLFVPHPEKLDDYLDGFARLFRDFHRVQDVGHTLPSTKEAFLRDLQTCDRWYDQQVIDEIRCVAERIPERDDLLHGDFHPGNVLVSEDGRLAVLDLGGMGHGHPVWDLMSFAMHYPFLYRHEVTRTKCERFHPGMSIAMHEQIWDGFIRRNYADRDEATRRRLNVQAEQITACFFAVIPAHLSRLPGRDVSGPVRDFLAKWKEYREVVLSMRDFDQFA